MFCRIVKILSLSATAILAKPLRMVDENTLSPSVSHLVDAALTANTSTSGSGLDTSVGDSFGIECNGDLYGFNPSLYDCENAARSIIPDSEQLVWGERHTGIEVEIFPLPFVVFGDRAECAIKPILRGDSRIARASLTQVKNAAMALSLRCVAGYPSQGGIATNIGGDNNLAVTLSPYEPNIQCARAATFTGTPTCGEILAFMPATTEKTRFGPEGQPDIQEALPQLFVSDDHSCLLRLFSSSGRVDSASWYSVWEAAEAIFAKCARERRAGSARALGDNREILMTLTALPVLSQPNSTQAATA